MAVCTKYIKTTMMRHNGQGNGPPRLAAQKKNIQNLRMKLLNIVGAKKLYQIPGITAK